MSSESVTSSLITGPTSDSTRTGAFSKMPFDQQEFDVVIATFTGISEVNNPMGTQEVIIGKRNTFVPSKLIVDFLPSVIYLLAEGRFVLLIKYVIVVKRR